MSRWILFFTSIVLSLPLILMAQQKSPTPKESQNANSDLLPFQATEKTLPNGLKVIIVPTGFPNIAFRFKPVRAMKWSPASPDSLTSLST